MKYEDQQLLQPNFKHYVYSQEDFLHFFILIPIFTNDHIFYFISLYMIKKLLKYTIFALITAIFGLYIIFTPPYATQVTFDQHKIKIIRDSYGIPHFQAPNRRSFLFAWGYALAEDRLFQISFRRFLAQGRLSEFVGNRTLQSDIFMRDLSLDEVSKHTANKIKAQNQTVHLDMSAFAQGINDQVASRLFYPMQYYAWGLKWQPWTVASIILLYKSFYFGVSHNMMQEYARSTLLVNYSIAELNRILPNTKQSWGFPSKNAIQDHDIPEYLKASNRPQTANFQPLEIENIIDLGIPQFSIPEGASNGWAVSGQHTESGKPILQLDPHVDNCIPSNWYPFTTKFVQNNRTIKYVGAGPPGITLSFGKSDYYAIAMTVCQTDTQDLYKEKIEGNKYLVDGQWRDLKIRNETILIKDGDKLTQYKHRVRLTHRGPILTSILSPYGNYLLKDPISLAWVGHNEDYQSFINTGLYSRQIDNFEDLKQALVNGTSHYFNMHVVAATVDNHLLYQQSGINPLRRNVTMGSYLKDGTTSENDWLGFMPAHERMHAFDPKKGYLATSNQRVTSQLYGDYYHHMIYTGRADRMIEGIEQEIASGRKITTEFAKKLAHSTLDVYCRSILAELMAVSPQAKQKLNGFDCDFTPESYQASLYQAFMYEFWFLIKPVQHESIGFLGMHVFPQCQYNAIHDAFNGDKQKQAAVHKAWQLGLVRLFKFFKTGDQTVWKWGQMLRDRSISTAFGNHPYLKNIFNFEAPGFGNYHTINIANYVTLQSGNFRTNKRSSVRMVFDMGRDDDQWILDTGVSQNILSKHYNDQWKVFMQNKLSKFQYPKSKNQQEL